MYYRLKDKYSLRGWELLPYAVVDRDAHLAKFVEKETFDALSLCDASVDIDLPLVPRSIRDAIKKQAEEGVVEACAPGDGIAERQKYRRYPNRFMAWAHWSITGRCNCKCRHCLLSAPDARYGELSHEDIMRIVNDLGDCGVLNCSITGGEPLVRPDFWEIIDALRDRDIGIIQIYSNGLAVNEDLLDGFERRGLRPEFNMSFDGVGHHDWLRGQPGAEKAVRRAFELCRDRGFPTGAEMCLWKENAHTLRESINYLASVGCRSIKTNPVADTGAWREGGYADKHDLSLDETLEIYLNYLDDFYRDLPPMFLHLGGFIAADGLLPDVYTLPVVHVAKDPDNVCMCAHARMSMYISAEGRAMTCMPISNNDEFMADYPRIQELGLRKCLTDSKYMELINTRAGEVLAHNEKCVSCRYRKLCLGGCRAAALLSHPRDILAPDEYTCRIFRDGWLQKIESRIAQLRPTAQCSQLVHLHEINDSDEPAKS